LLVLTPTTTLPACPAWPGAWVQVPSRPTLRKAARQAIADKLNTSRRTIERDLNAHVRIETEQNPRKERTIAPRTGYLFRTPKNDGRAVVSRYLDTTPT
jgi:hypothetical protein